MAELAFSRDHSLKVRDGVLRQLSSSTWEEHGPLKKTKFP